MKYINRVIFVTKNKHITSNINYALKVHVYCSRCIIGCLRTNSELTCFPEIKTHYIKLFSKF